MSKWKVVATGKFTLTVIDSNVKCLRRHGNTSKIISVNGIKWKDIPDAQISSIGKHKLGKFIAHDDIGNLLVRNDIVAEDFEWEYVTHE